MKSEPVFLDELTTSSRAYKVKVKVIEKTRPQVSPSKKKVSYQNVVLEDEKGNKMRGTLFGDQIDSYEEAFVHNGVYEISNAPIKPVDVRYRKHGDALNYEMGFGRQTVIQPAGEEKGPVLPQYIPLGHIPRASGVDDRFDVLGVVLHVDSQTRPVVTKKGNETTIRDVSITDHSSERPVTVTLWSDLAEAKFAFFSTWAESFQVIGFTAMKVYTVNGFSLSASMSTTIVENPKGDRAEALKEWVSKHQTALADSQAKLLDIRNSRNEKKLATIAELRKKKATNTLQEERLWLTASLNDLDFDQIYAYLGGSKCGKRADAVGPCVACDHGGCIAGPRMNLTCEITDGEDFLVVTAFTENAEKLLETSAADIFHMKHTHDFTAFEKMKKRLEGAQVMVEMGPHTNLSRNNVLQWVLKSVEDTANPNGDTSCNAEGESSAATHLEVTENAISNKAAALPMNNDATGTALGKKVVDPSA